MSGIKKFFKRTFTSDSAKRENEKLNKMNDALLEEQLTKTEEELLEAICLAKMELNDRQPIGRLPDLCLLALLKQMTPEDQICASKVCTRWSVLVPEATQTKRRLSILLGTGELADYEQLFMEQPWMHSSLLKHITDDRGQPLFPYRRLTPWNTLRLQYLSDDLISLITSTFAGIKELQVAAYGSCTTTANDTLIDLRNLLSQWRHDLIAFKLAERSREVGDPFFIKMSNSAIAAFYSALNSMTTLQCLSIRLNDMPLHDLPILSRLKEFHFDSRNPKLQSWENLMATLEKHAKGNSGLRRIAFGEGVFFGDPQQNLTSLSDGLCDRFIRLDSALSLHNLFAVGLQFRQLTSLHTADKPYRYLLNQLSNLPSLSHLCLSINFKDYIAYYTTTKFKSPTATAGFFTDDQPPDCPLPQLHSVKSLHLQLQAMFSHECIIKLNLPWTMPQLQVVQFEPGNRCQCFSCFIHELDYADISPDGLGGRCLRQMGAPLKRDCAKLKAIFFTWAGEPPVELL